MKTNTIVLLSFKEYQVLTNKGMVKLGNEVIFYAGALFGFFYYTKELKKAIQCEIKVNYESEEN